MNVFQKVTGQSLKENRTRTVVTIIGIMLSAAMICAVTTFVSSIQNYALEYMIYNYGDWHGAAYNVEQDGAQSILQDEQLSSAVFDRQLGYARIESTNPYKPYLYVLGAGEGFLDKMPVHLLEGRFPENAGEIMLPEHLSTNGGLSHRVGDVITLGLGERMWDGCAMTQNNPNYSYDDNTREEVLNSEEIVVRETRTYTVVGIYARPNFENRTAPGYTALTVAEDTGEYSYDIYFKMKNPKDVYDYVENMDYSGTWNSSVLTYTGVSRYNTFYTVLLGLTVIVTGLIVFGSVALIYNAFSISVSERTRQFGLLASIGATKKQLRSMVFYEALMVSAVGIPLGISTGIAGIAVTLLLIGSKFSSIVGNFDAPMRICVSWEAVMLAVLVALITVLLSAWIPSKRATKVSAVEAIRQHMDVKEAKRPVKVSRLTYKLFGLPGVLARKHYKRNRRKYRATVVSLFMSIVLFVSTAAFSDYLMESVTGGIGGAEYDFYLSMDDVNDAGLTQEEMKALLQSDENVTDAAYLKRLFVDTRIEKQYLHPDFLENLEAGNLADNTHGESDYLEKEDNTVPLRGYLLYVDEASFDELLRKNKLKREDFYDTQNPRGVVVDESYVFDNSKGKYVRYDVLKGQESVFTCEAEENDGSITNYTLVGGAAITERPFYLEESTITRFLIIYPLSMLEETLPEAERSTIPYCRHYLLSDDYKASEPNLRNKLRDKQLDPDILVNYAENEETERNIISIVQVFSYGFIVLISLIAAANVFNTISTNISLRRREFAMLKSVGMTQSGFHRMMNYECLLYGSKALLLGLPMSAGVTYLIYLAIMSGYETDYRLPWGAVGIACLSVFLVVFATMMYSMRKIGRDNPIDALKNENL